MLITSRVKSSVSVKIYTSEARREDKMMQKHDILHYLKSHQDYYRKQFGVEFVGIFGSFSRDEANESSDIDILYKIEKDRKLSIFNYLKINKELEDFFDKKIDLVRYEKLKPQIKSHIQKDISYV